jgi:hypothetical protein
VSSILASGFWVFVSGSFLEKGNPKVFVPEFFDLSFL